MPKHPKHVSDPPERFTWGEDDVTIQRRPRGTPEAEAAIDQAEREASRLGFEKYGDRFLSMTPADLEAAEADEEDE